MVATNPPQSELSDVAIPIVPTSSYVTINEISTPVVPNIRAVPPPAGSATASTTIDMLPPTLQNGLPEGFQPPPLPLVDTGNIPRPPHDGAYGGFMVVLPPPAAHPHNGEMTEYQRAQLPIPPQHLILYGLAHTHTHPKPYPGTANLPNLPNDDIGPPKVDFNAPPAYESVAKPPTYEDVQREKRLEERYISGGANGPPPTGLPNRSNRPIGFLGPMDGENGRDSESDALLGTDFMFITAFIVAFLFNWIGFLLLICFCHTVAARYGALSGFGVSLAKWTFIVRTSTEVTNHENDWLWWLIMAFGCLICVRAFLQYITIKRSWNSLSEQAQERFFFIY